MNNTLNLKIIPNTKSAYSTNVSIRRIGCSRNASRDIESTNKHLNEARAEGYQVHDAAGICFRSSYLLTNEDTIEVQGPQTSGEVEFVAFQDQATMFVSVGSDHNDRSLSHMWTPMLGKIYDTAKSKQMVPAVMAKEAWLYDDVKDHWDGLVLRSFVNVTGKRTPYQEFALSNLLDLDFYLLEAHWLKKDGSFLLGGSYNIMPGVPVNVFQGQETLDNVIFPQNFEFEIFDPVLKRKISHKYNTISLEPEGSLSL